MVIKVGDGFPLDLIKDRIREYEYLLRDEFLTPRLAGAVNGTAAEPGPGSRIVTDILSVISITEGKISIGNGDGTSGNERISWGPYGRAAGLCLVGKGLILSPSGTGGFCYWGFDKNLITQNDNAGFLRSIAYIYYLEAAGNNQIVSSANNSMDFAVSVRATGNFGFIKLPGESWQLIWVSNSGSDADLYAFLSVKDAGGFLSLKRVMIPDQLWLPRPLASDGFATPPTIKDQGGISDGTASNVGLGGAANGAHFGGDSYIDIYSADLNTRFNGAEGTALVRFKMNTPALNITSAHQRMLTIKVDANNLVRISKRNVADSLQINYVAGGTGRSINIVSSSTSWRTLGLTWSKSADELKDYLDGANSTTLNGLGVWAGNLNASNTVIGAESITPAIPYYGLLSNVIVGYGIVATAAQMATLHSLLDAGTLTTADLDSVFGAGNWSWWKLDERYETDGNGHAEGPNPDDVGGGGAVRAWTNRTFAISAAGGTFQNNLLGQTDLVTNGDFTNWTGGDPDNWTVTESLPNMEVSETGGGGHGTGGNGHCNLYRNGAGSGTNPRIRQAILTVAAWYKVLVDIDTVVNGGLTVKDSGGNLSANFSAAATDNLLTGVVTGTNLDIATNADPTDVTFDNVRVQELLLNELMTLQNYSTEDVLATVTITARLVNTQVGLATNVDDPDNPQSFLLVYYNSKNDHVVLDKYVSGTRTNLLDVAAAYSATGELRIVKNGTSVRVYYNDAYIGEATVSDPEIINNTYHGLFSTDPANTLDNYYIYASNGKNGEYDILDEF